MAASAPVSGVAWAVISRQPLAVPEVAVQRMPRESATATGGAVLLISDRALLHSAVDPVSSSASPSNSARIGAPVRQREGGVACQNCRLKSPTARSGSRGSWERAAEAAPRGAL